MTGLFIVALVVGLWWSAGIIATVVLYNRGKIATQSDMAFLCFLSIFPGPIAFTLLRD